MTRIVTPRNRMCNRDERAFIDDRLPFDLPMDWRAIESSAGDVFFYNQITGERTWEPPVPSRRPSPPPVMRNERGWPQLTAPPDRYDAYDRYDAS